MGGKGGAGGEWQLKYDGAPGGGGASVPRQRPEQQRQDSGDDHTMTQASRPSRPDPGGGVKQVPSIAPATMITKPTAMDRLKNAGKYAALGIATPGTFLAGGAYGAMTAKGKKTPLGNAAAGSQGSLISDNDETDSLGSSPTSADLNDFSF